jgi:hypothetical protein
VIVKKAKMCEKVGLSTYGKRRECYMEYGSQVTRHGLITGAVTSVFITEVTNSGRQSEE